MDGTADPRKAKELFKEVETICDERLMKNAGEGKIFGELVSSGELHIRIGLEGDTNINTTRRMLFLTDQSPFIVRKLARKY